MEWRDILSHVDHTLLNPAARWEEVRRIVDEGIKGDLMVDGKRYGLVLDVGGYYKNVITLAPSLNITREEVDLAMRLLDEILRRVTKN